MQEPIGKKRVYAKIARKTLTVNKTLHNVFHVISDM